MTKIDYSELITIKQVAQRLHCSTRTLQRRMKYDGFPFVRVGKRAYLFNWSKVSSWLEARETTKPLPTTADLQLVKRLDAEIASGKLISLKQAAKLAKHKTLDAVRQWRQSGKVPSIKHRGMIYFYRSDVMAFMETKQH